MISNESLPDMQKSTDGFSPRAIDKVGVRGIKMNVNVQSGDVVQSVNATFSSYCNLVRDLKGINMSRITRNIISTVEDMGDAGITDLSLFAARLKEAHGTDNIYIKMAFEYTRASLSPMSGLVSYEPVDVVLETTSICGEVRNYMTVTTTGMSLCPCSKEMSMLSNNITEEEKAAIETLPIPLQSKIYRAGFGAHNQNSLVEIKVEIDSGAHPSIESIIDIATNATSAPIFGTLKREDEKYVTEVSYAGGYFNDDKEFVEIPDTGAKFVEDIARCAADSLGKLVLSSVIRDYVVVVNNDESIHPDPLYATAIISFGRDLK